MSKSKIAWTDQTWNPIIGCSKISDGCKNCYAERMAGRLSHMHEACYEDVVEVNFTCTGLFGWNGKTALVHRALPKPLHWRKPRRIFVCSMGDLFHESVPWEWIHRVMLTIASSQQHTFQILTKRADRMAEYFTMLAGDCCFGVEAENALGWDRKAHAMIMTYRRGGHLPNLWLGTTCENQQTADERIPHLLRCPAAVRFVSVEPMLGPVDLEHVHFAATGATENVLCCDVSPTAKRAGIEKLNGIDWVICGGESGSGARPMHPDWARSLRDQCARAELPFMLKQWGEWAPAYAPRGYDAEGLHPDDYRDGYIDMEGMRTMRRVGKKRAGRLLDGALYDGMPEGDHV